MINELEVKLAEVLMKKLADHAPALKDELKKKVVELAINTLLKEVPADSKIVKITNAVDKLVIEIDKTAI